MARPVEIHGILFPCVFLNRLGQILIPLLLRRQVLIPPLLRRRLAPVLLSLVCVHLLGQIQVMIEVLYHHTLARRRALPLATLASIEPPETDMVFSRSLFLFVFPALLRRQVPRSRMQRHCCLVVLESGRSSLLRTFRVQLGPKRA